MRFNDHSDLEGKHAFLSASKYTWLNYDEDKLVNSYYTSRATQRGTELHEFAAEAIRLGIKLPKTRETLNMYVNDAIGFRMQPEQVLKYSDNAFGTADAISFRKVKGRYLLRVHDLKTGVTKASFSQLLIYVAFFCHEYGFKPSEIDAELRIYQNNAVEVYVPDVTDIVRVYEHVKWSDEIISNLKAGDD